MTMGRSISPFPVASSIASSFTSSITSSITSSFSVTHLWRTEGVSFRYVLERLEKLTLRTN
eukprot:CAMPEP_0184544002 /NCGR_PEP_ID=MMETSP0199_2-20130426/3340_1 /TAXON_ID=1112570 /ORGANISM="Thraustochytrium sp., Strain LLF1b" /LENGTH=60 /DNA_ID=CAMNT_0026938127 /DNA_START=313 /DNA_END=495 /DNA_ORIENTATION=-